MALDRGNGQRTADTGLGRPPLKTVLCGVGGFGGWYLRNFLDRPDSPLEFIGFVDPVPERSPFLERIRSEGHTIHPSLEEFYAREGAELAIVASPIQFHAAQTIYALEHGSHVICEKPVCATVQDAHAMLAAQRRAGKLVTVGYQGSFAGYTQRLKADILAGVWGRPLAAKCFSPCPRTLKYYLRNGWAGHKRDAQGRWVLDSPVNNAVAHFLHHMLYLLGDAVERSAVPVEVEAGLYRAHAIENYDTAFLRCKVAGGAELFFVTSHAGVRDRSTAFELTFEKGTVKYELPANDVTGTFSDGTRRSYGGEEQDNCAKVLDTVRAIVEGRPSPCGIEAAMSQTICMNGVQESGEPVVDFPRELVHEIEGDKEGEFGRHWLAVDGLDEVMMKAYQSARVPDASDAPWARPGRKFGLTDYASFPAGNIE